MNSIAIFEEGVREKHKMCRPNFLRANSASNITDKSEMSAEKSIVELLKKVHHISPSPSRRYIKLFAKSLFYE